MLQTYFIDKLVRKKAHSCHQNIFFGNDTHKVQGYCNVILHNTQKLVLLFLNFGNPDSFRLCVQLLLLAISSKTFQAWLLPVEIVFLSFHSYNESQKLESIQTLDIKTLFTGTNARDSKLGMLRVPEMHKYPWVVKRRLLPSIQS